MGSGPSGSSFAALIAHAGHSVVLPEKNRFACGQCSSLPHEGYVMDTGVHMFVRGPRCPFGHITRILGEGHRWSAAIPVFSVYLFGKSEL
ncbi:MAG: FAD/NAD(P)-binding protein [Actinomycetota bacterium]|nr:FAD/NAD(P)-binding protein [Actinomycetota bacterium]